MLKGLQYLCWAMVAHLWLVFVSPGAFASEPDTVLILSSDNPFYQQTVQTLKTQADRPARFTTIILDSTGQTDSPLPARAAHIITFGSKAVDFVLENDLAGKSIASYLTGEQYQRLEQNQLHSVVLLDQPLQRYLAFSSAMINGAVTGTLLLETTETQPDITPNLPPSLQARVIEAPNRLLSNLRDMLSSIDVFLMTPNRGLYNRNSLRGILLTAYRAGKPVVSYSPAHVKSGALGSIYSSPENIGRHLLEILGDKSAAVDGRATVVEYARYYTISTNKKVASSLGIEIPEEANLRQIMQDQRP